jgi:hypothetical protein
MIRPFLPALLLLTALVLPARAADAATFTVLDQKAPEEYSETTRLYIDGTLVATVRLDDATTQASIPVSVPDTAGPHGREHEYALCGEITFRNDAGAREIHEVSGQGLLPDPDGRAFDALGARDFTLFYLADPGDPQAVRIHPGHSAFCQAPVS